MKLARLSSFGLMVLFAASTALADVHVTMETGRVSIVAKDATLRQILAEWARVGHTTIVNVDKIPGGPISLELTRVPEPQALDVLLRSLAGYIAAPRSEVVANLSVFDRIIVMPALAAATPPPPAAPPVVPQAVFTAQPAETAEVAMPASAAAGENPADQAGPAANPYSQPRGFSGQGQPRIGGPAAGGFPHSQAAIGPTAFPGPGAAAGVAVPGTMPPPRPLGVSGTALPPQTPGQEIAPQPSQFRRPGGGS